MLLKIESTEGDDFISSYLFSQLLYYKENHFFFRALPHMFTMKKFSNQVQTERNFNKLTGSLNKELFQKKRDNFLPKWKNG